MPGSDTRSPLAVALGLARAMNARDIDAFVSSFSKHYESEQPAHPDRSFRGRDQVRANWSAVFCGVPDFSMELVASAANLGCDQTMPEAPGPPAEPAVIRPGSDP